MKARQRSSSALSNHSDIHARNTPSRSPSPFTPPRPRQEPEDLVLNDVPTYGTSTKSLLIPSQGTGSPYPAISGPPSYVHNPSSPAQRPRASTTDLPGISSPYRTAFKMADRSRIPLEYLQGQRHPSNPPPNMDVRQPYIPGPPPSAMQSHNHMMNLPPPPPRPPAINQQHSMVPPPPPGPPPAPYNQLSSGWSQQHPWARQQTTLPPPPPLGPNQIGAQFGGHPSYQHQPPSKLSIPPPPSQEQVNLVSATYIPGGDSFGPGVGIPGLYTSQESDEPFGRDESFSYQEHQANLLEDQRYYNGPSSAISPNGEPPKFPEKANPAVSQPSAPRRDPSFKSAKGGGHMNLVGQTPPSTTQETTAPITGHRRSGSNGLLSPNNPILHWPLDKVLVWLAVNGFSNDWQETFKGLDIHGSDFLDLGRGQNGRGNFGMMHQLVYPRLARECVKSGSGWNQDRERNEGRRMRRLIRKITEGVEGVQEKTQNRRESGAGLGGGIPSASTDGNLENSPVASNLDISSVTPSTAGGGEESPSRQFRSALPGMNPRMASKTRSSTAPMQMYARRDASQGDSGSQDAGAPRAGYTRGVLSNINDAASKRHSPNASSDIGNGAPGSSFPADAMRGTYDASPQSGSPATQHAPLAPSGAANGTLSAPPGGRYGHRKSGSTDSVLSNQTSHSTASLLRGLDRRNGQDGHRPPTIDVAGKSAVNDPPPSAKELSKGFLDRFRKRKNADSSHQSPEDHGLESPTSPLSYRHIPPSLPFAKGTNGSSTSLDRPSSASSKVSEHDRLRDRDRGLTRSGGGRRYAFVTPDQWNYRLVDVTEADTADGVRECICRALHYTEHEMALIYLTEPGQLEHDDPLSDAFLLMAKHTRADSHGSLKFFVRRGPTSASLAPPLSAGLGIGNSPKVSPPAGSLFPRKALDEEGYARLRSNARTRSKSPPMTSRQNTLKAENSTREPETAPEALLDTNVNQTNSPPAKNNAKQRLSAMRTVRESGNLSDTEWGTYLAAAVEEHRLEMEKQGKDYQLGRQLRTSSHPDSGSSNRAGFGRDGEINFDEPRDSPYDVRKSDPLVPLRKPPAPPPGSVMLEKANSLTRKAGDQLRSSISGQSDPMKRQSIADPISEEPNERGRTKDVGSTPSVSAGIGPALVSVADAASTIGKPIGSRRNLPLRAPAGSGREPPPTLQTAGFGNWGKSFNNFGGSSRDSSDSMYQRDSMSYKTLGFREGTHAPANSRRPSLALQTGALAKNPSIESIKRKSSINSGPADTLSRKGSLASRPRSYGPNFAFKESEVSFDHKRVADDESDEDSDDGLFAKPLAKSGSSKPLPAQGGPGDESVHRRPTLKLNTNDQRKSKARSVSWKETPLSTVSTAQSSDTPELDEDGRIVGMPPDEKQVVDSATVGSRSAQSPDAAAAKLARRQSFARDDVWANRPPAEDLLNNLDDFFPNLDLDQPVVEDLVSSPPVSPEAGNQPNPMDTAPVLPEVPRRNIRSSLYDRVRPDSIAEEPDTLGSEESTLKSRAPVSAMPSVAQRNVRKSGGLGRMKSIRDVARGAYEGNSRRNTQIPAAAKSGDILRRKSTKMFGANIVQIKPGRGSRVSLIEAVPKDLPPGTNTFQISRGQLIGKGSYGRVYLGLNMTTGDFLAVKQVEVNHREAGHDKDKMKEMVKALDGEIDTMQHLEHPNIVQYLGCERKEYSISIFLEYISGGSVGSCLRKHGKFDESLVSCLTRQTLAGLAYLHQEGVLHRDLKADNILLDCNGTCKISDFGISKKTDNIYGNDSSNNMQGSVFWMAPEVVRSQGQGYSAKVDVWSLGCVVLEMFAGRRPWHKEEAIGAIYKLGSLNEHPPMDAVSDSISAEAVGFMLDCFTIDPGERPTAERLLHGHAFVKADPYYNFLDTELHRKLVAAKIVGGNKG